MAATSLCKAPAGWSTNDMLYSLMIAQGTPLSVAPAGFSASDVLYSIAQAPVATPTSGGTADNPTAQVGLTAVNGVATTYMRSDAAPKLNVGISPVWTGNHTFFGAITTMAFLNVTSIMVGEIVFNESDPYGAHWDGDNTVATKDAIRDKIESMIAPGTPASATAAGVAGTIRWDASFLYVCTATNTWKRAAIATW